MFASFAAVGVVASAAVRPSLLFSDNMVLVSSATQSASVFGYADPGERVTLERANGATISATADDDGWWRIVFPPHVRVQGEPSFVLTLSSSGGETITVTNVAYGDVFLCSGQRQVHSRVLEEC